MKARLIPMLLVLAIGALFAAGCGGDDEEPSDTGASTPAETAPTESAPPAEETAPEASEGSGGGGELQIAADPGGMLVFDKETLTAKAGEVKIVMDNPSEIEHAIAIDVDGKVTTGPTVGKGGTSEASVELEPGEYEYLCPVAGHDAAGMKGTLTVE